MSIIIELVGFCYGALYKSAYGYLKHGVYVKLFKFNVKPSGKQIGSFFLSLTELFFSVEETYDTGCFNMFGMLTVIYIQSDFTDVTFA